MGENPIAARSKKRLTNALSELIEEKPYRDITITELCAKAKLSRPAFYQNFNSMDEILDRLIHERIVATMRDAGASPVSASQLCLDAAEAEKDFWEKAFASGHAMNVREQLAAAISADAVSGRSVSYRDAYRAYGIAAVVVAWAAGGMVESSEEIEELLSSLA